MRRSGVAGAATSPVAVILLMAVLFTHASAVRAQDDPATVDAVRHAKSLSAAFRAAARKVIPAVVEVQTRYQPPGAAFVLPLDDMLSGGPAGAEMTLGSGVILDAKGVVLTNNHVIEDADRLLVKMANGRRIPVKQTLIDEKTDLAVLVLDTEDELPFATLGDSDLLDIGDWVLAIGSPFELDLSVSAGIVSATGRSLGPTQRANFIQTDAAINPGNSGGPLVNIDGQVIGINTAIATRTGGYQGIGFAIPSSMAQWVVRQLLEYGEVQRAYLGVSIRPLTVEDARRLGLEVDSGVVVQRLFEKSPAENAGLRRDDVILTFDGHRIGSANDLQQIVEVSDIEASHEIVILRNGRRMTLPVQLETMPREFGREANLLGEAPEYFRDPTLGVLLVELTDRLANRFGFGQTEGVLIVDVARGGPAFAAGVRPGMLIVKIGDAPIGSMRDYEEAVKKHPLREGTPMELLSRDGTSVSVTIGGQ